MLGPEQSAPGLDIEYETVNLTANPVDRTNVSGRRAVATLSKTDRETPHMGQLVISRASRAVRSLPAPVQEDRPPFEMAAPAATAYLMAAAEAESRAKFLCLGLQHNEPTSPSGRDEQSASTIPEVSPVMIIRPVDRNLTIGGSLRDKKLTEVGEDEHFVNEDTFMKACTTQAEEEDSGGPGRKKLAQKREHEFALLPTPPEQGTSGKDGNRRRPFVRKTGRPWKNAGDEDKPTVRACSPGACICKRQREVKTSVITSALCYVKPGKITESEDRAITPAGVKGKNNCKKRICTGRLDVSSCQICKGAGRLYENDAKTILTAPGVPARSASPARTRSLLRTEECEDRAPGGHVTTSDMTIFDAAVSEPAHRRGANPGSEVQTRQDGLKRRLLSLTNIVKRQGSDAVGLTNTGRNDTAPAGRATGTDSTTTPGQQDDADHLSGPGEPDRSTPDRSRQHRSADSEGPVTARQSPPTTDSTTTPGRHRNNKMMLIISQVGASGLEATGLTINGQ